jgi:hypothetical protein
MDMKEAVEINEYIPCECTSEIVHLQYDEELDMTYLSIYEVGCNKNHKFSLWQRIRFCFKILFKGRVYGDQVVLKDNHLKSFSHYINRVDDYKFHKPRKEAAEKQLLLG